jgi:nitroreductase
MDLETAIRDRRSVRQYSKEPVSDEVLRRVIEAATLAPSAMNEQPWLFAVVRDKALLERVSREGKAATLAMMEANGAPRERLEKLRSPAYDILYNAPALIVIASASAGPWAAVNCGLAAQNLMLAARAEGLGTCWIGQAQAWVASADGKAALRLPADCVPVGAIIIGHTAAFPPPVARKAAEVKWIG